MDYISPAYRARPKRIKEERQELPDNASLQATIIDIVDQSLSNESFILTAATEKATDTVKYAVLEIAL
jgi:hypothetical protein